MADSGSGGNPVSSNSNAAKGSSSSQAVNEFKEQFSEVIAKVNETLGKIDWAQMGKYGKAVGIIAAVIFAQVVVKVVIDTINFFPLLPSLLELLGVVVLGQWSWQNLTTSEKRTAVFDKVQNLRKEYLG